MGHSTLVVHGLTGGHCHRYMQSSQASLSVSMVVFHLRMVRGMGVVLIPMLTASRKLVMALFCGGKKGVDHGKIIGVPV